MGAMASLSLQEKSPKGWGEFISDALFFKLTCRASFVAEIVRREINPRCAAAGVGLRTGLGIHRPFQTGWLKESPGFLISFLKLSVFQA